MLDKVFTNNQVTIAGKVVSEFAYSHTVYGEDFYTVDIEVSRLSNSNDIIPVMVSERILDVHEDYRGYVLHANGQFRSYNRHEETRNRLVLSVFAREVAVMEPEEDEQDPNHIFLDGYVCKKPVYRKTPLGRQGDCRCAAGSEPPVWQVGLYSVYLLGKECPLCRSV